VSVEGLKALYEAKARAELAQADGLCPGSDAVASSGDPLACVVLVKGSPGAEELAAHRALAGPVGDAALKAVAALGLDPRSTFALCSRPGGDAGARAERLELAVEAVDPALVLALDAAGAEDLAAALHCGPLEPGRPVTVRGRTVGYVGDLAASLRDDDKRPVWAAFLSIASALTASMRDAASSGALDTTGGGRG